MPTVLTPQGWVKVAPAPRKKQTVANPKAALRGPLAYLACQPQPPTVNVGGGGVKGKAPFPYDLSATPEKLKRQNHANINRTVSEPVMHGSLHNEEDYDNEILEPERVTSKSPSGPRSKTKHRSSRPNDDDNHSVASSSSSTSSRSGQSYARHRPPVEARPRPPPAGSNDYYSVPRYDQRFAPPPQVMHVPMPMPPSSGRSMSYSWYNATTPLNMN
ncbi:hypothetical protein H2200_011460 [Cladophialophora chaetospira]|uniref:Uncharacterized protein n=1 Tax=Cladophialophora chaetospira TaxID=386627 RepID=A0AA39CD57_9EURO|nr:hypothetical protein H2200_011460 [Cladophialophora chaetospira]